MSNPKPDIVNRSLRITEAQWQSLQVLAERAGCVAKGKPAVNRLIIYWLDREMQRITNQNAIEVQFSLTNPITTPPSQLPPELEDGNMEKFSDLLSDDWRKVFKRLRDNPNLTSLKEDLALLELMQREILKSLKMGEGLELWMQLSLAASDARIAYKSGDQERYSSAINTILNLIANGASAASKREHLMKTMELKSKLAKAQSDIDLKSQELLPRAVYEDLISEWREAARLEVGNDVLDRICQRYEKAMLERALERSV